LAEAILAARDSRQQALDERLRAAASLRAAVFLSLNIPGSDKMPPGAQVFFAFMREKLIGACGTPAGLEEGEDALGRYAIALFDESPLTLKQRCVELEAIDPCARLADLDVYTAAGDQVGRSALGLPARSCFVCAQTAVDCIRNKRHSRDEIIGHAHALLARFRA